MSESFGTRLREARKARGLKIADLAELAGVAYNSIHYWEQDKIWPSLLNAICLADALGVSLDWLAGRENK